MKTVTVSTAETRNNLSRILSEAYFSDTIFLVTKNKKVIAEIKKPASEILESNIKKFAGVLSDEDADIILKSIKENDKLSARSTKIKPL